MTLAAAFNRRYLSILSRSELYGIPPPPKDALHQKVESSFLDGFTCCYCRRKLKITEPAPSLSVFSLDHWIPLALGGTNRVENIVVCCHSCNIIKGTMTGYTYRELIGHIPESLRDKMFTEIWRGRITDKIERVEAEKVGV